MNMLQQDRMHDDDHNHNNGHDIMVNLIEAERSHFAALWAVFLHSVERARQKPKDSSAVHDVEHNLDHLVGLYTLIGIDSALFAVQRAGGGD